MSNTPHAKHAEKIGLVIIAADDLTIAREGEAGAWTYRRLFGNPKVAADRISQIEDLVIPPNWQEVRIAADPQHHLQAVGRDAAGRLQYRYHDDWERVRNRVKAERLLVFGRALPKLRRRLKADLRRRKLTRDSVAAAALSLIDRKLVRPGHEKYTVNGTAGAATLKTSHVRDNGDKTRIAFRGKSGKDVKVDVKNTPLRRKLGLLKRKNRGRLFAYEQNGMKRRVGAVELNTYMRDTTNRAVSAKDFRTFAASAMALGQLCRAVDEQEKMAPNRIVARTMKTVAKRLRNTPAVTRSSYVHPAIVDAFENGTLDPSLIKGRQRTSLDREETALMRFLEQGLN